MDGKQEYYGRALKNAVEAIKNDKPLVIMTEQNDGYAVCILGAKATDLADMIGGILDDHPEVEPLLAMRRLQRQFRKGKDE